MMVMFEGRRQRREVTKIETTDNALALAALAEQVTKAGQLTEAGMVFKAALFESRISDVTNIMVMQESVEGMLKVAADNPRALKKALLWQGQIKEKLAAMPFSETVGVMMKTHEYQQYFLDEAFRRMMEGQKSSTAVYRTEQPTEVGGFPVRADTPVTWDRETVVALRPSLKTSMASLPEPVAEYGWTDEPSDWSETESTAESGTAA